MRNAILFILFHDSLCASKTIFSNGFAIPSHLSPYSPKQPNKTGRGVEGAQRCERLCNRLLSLYENNSVGRDAHSQLRPVPHLFGAVIDAWAKAGHERGSAERAEALLGRMEELFLGTENQRERLINVPYNSGG